VLDRWQQSEFSKGFKRLHEIAIPTDELTVPAVEPPSERKSKTVLKDPAPRGRMAVISLVLTAPGVEVDDYPAPSWLISSGGNTGATSRAPALNSQASSSAKDQLSGAIDECGMLGEPIYSER
jgi:hypothetical protein